MDKGAVIFNRQVIRLCKGILKAWEQWMDEVEYKNSDKIHEFDPQALKKDKEKEPYSKTINS
jgi:hypothetical protein